MQHTLKRLLASGALLAATFVPSAQAATVIDFEGAALTGLYLPGDTFAASGYTFTTQIDFGVVDTAAALGGTGPSGNATQFYFNANDGKLSVARSDGGLFTLDGFSAAFVPLDPASAQTTVLVALATLTGGVQVQSNWAFASSNTSSFPFTVYDSSTAFGVYASLGFTRVDFFACSLVGDSVCTQPTLNNGQFAIDDIVLSAGVVPEPGTALLLALGASALALRSRRYAR